MAAPLTAQVTVVYEAAAPDCPEAEAFASRVNALLGRRALEPGLATPARRGPSTAAAPTTLEVRLGRDGTRRTARVVASGELWGARELSDEGESCEGLAEAVVTSLALMIESASNDGTRDGAEALSPSEPLHVEAYAGAMGALGLLHGVRPLGWAGAQLGVGGRFGVALGVTYVVPQSLSREGVDVDLGLVFGQAELCARALEGPRLSLGACAGGAVGALAGRARDVDNATSRTRTWGAASAGLVATGPSGAGVGWWARLGGWVPVRRPGFSVEGVGAVFEQAPVAAGLGGGLRWSNW